MTVEVIIQTTEMKQLPMTHYDTNCVFVTAPVTFSDGLFSPSFLFFSELDLLLPLLLLLEDEELEEDLESCLLKLSFDTDPFDTSIS